MRLLDPRRLLPPGLVVDAIEPVADRVVILVHAPAAPRPCPACGEPTNRLHSRYERRLLDLPSHGVPLNCSCNGAAFGVWRLAARGRPSPSRCRPRSRGDPDGRTARLDGLVERLGVALGGRPTAGLARRLMLPVGKDTLLRVVRRQAPEAAGPIRALGIDEWAWRRVSVSRTPQAGSGERV